MASEHVADASPVAPSERDERVTRRRPDGMHHDERRVVLDPGTGAEGAHEVVDLLSRAEARIRAEPERLVERPDLLDDCAAREDRRRGPGVPHVVLTHATALDPPAAGCPPVLVLEAAADDAERRVLREARSDLLEESGRVAAVVVRERDEICPEQAERGVPGARQPRAGEHALDPKRRVRGEQPGDPVVVVLVDEEHASRWMRLCLERAEEPVELVRPTDGRDDEVDARARGSGHRRRLPSATR